MQKLGKPILVVVICLYLPAVPVALATLSQQNSHHRAAFPIGELLVFPGWFPAWLAAGSSSESSEWVVFSITAAVVTLSLLWGLIWFASRSLGNMIGVAVIALTISILQSLFFAFVIALVGQPPG